MHPEASLLASVPADLCLEYGALSISALSVRVAKESSVDAVLVRFEETSFNGLAFSRAGVALPESVARSVKSRQAQFFFGRWAALIALQRIGCPRLDIAIGPSREPLWPAGVVGSIAHTPGIAAACADDRKVLQGLGIDVERVASEEGVKAISSVALSGEEIALLRNDIGSWPRGTLATAVFSAKESIFKCAFPSVRRYFDFSAARLLEVDVSSGTLLFTLVTHLNEQFTRGRVFEVTIVRLDDFHVLTAVSA